MNEPDELGEFLESARRAGELESSGRITIDVERALKQLSRFQLIDSHAYIKTVVSTAVLGGATFLQVSSHQGVLTFHFDGRVLSQDEVGALLGLPGDPFQREFGLAWLHSLGLEPTWVKLRSGSSQVSVIQGAISVEEAEGQDNLLQIGPLSNLRRRLNRLVALPEFVLLRESCTLAPLRLTLNGRLLQGSVDFGRALGVRRVGVPNRLPVKAQAASELEPQPLREGSEDWCGVLAMGADKKIASLAVVNGVTYPLPIKYPYPDCQAVISQSSLPLDLSRSKVAESEALLQLNSRLEEQFDELALQICLDEKADDLLSLLWERHVPRIAEGFDYPFRRSLAATKPYIMADGSQCSLVDLVEQSLNDGYLGVTSRAWNLAHQPGGVRDRLFSWVGLKFSSGGRLGGPVLWDGSQILVGGRFLAKALHFFPCLSVDHLAQARSVHRLPLQGQQYLIRVPLLEVAGEIGLRPESPDDRYAYEVVEGPQRALPLGVEVALPPKTTDKQARSTLSSLYLGLVWKSPKFSAQERIWMRHHLLAYLSHLCDYQQTTLSQLIQERGDEIRDLALQVHLPTIAGPQVSLLQLLDKPTWYYRERLGGPPSALFCNHLQRSRLLTLLGPGSLLGHGLTHFSQAVAKFCAATQTQVGKPITTLIWLRRMWSLPDCAATQILWRLGVGPEHEEHLEKFAASSAAEGLESCVTTSAAVHHASREAMEQVGKLEAFHLATDHLLLGLLRTEANLARAYLQSCGVTYAAVEALVKENRYREALADLDRALTHYPNPLDFCFRAEAHFRLGDFAAAQEDAQQALHLDPECSQARQWMG